MAKIDEIAEKLTVRHRPLGAFWQAVFIALTLIGVFVAVNQIFNLRFFVGVTILENRYLYILLGIFLSLAFLVFPAHGRDKARVPWYDVVLFLAALGSTGYFAYHAETIVFQAWEFNAPFDAALVGVVLWALLIEASRRTGGWIFMGIILIFSMYPVFAGELPEPLEGYHLPFLDTIRYHTMGVEAVLGIPMRVFGTLFIGFLIFGVALQVTGGGQFFTNLALALLGGFRGGAAKVAIFASALFGSMSGSAISNVLSTGQVTIPTMIRTGFSRESAAAIEANASSGGTVMPPVMAATAFLMASILGVPYVEVAIAAAIPITLYFFSLFLQLDAYAAKNGIKGVPVAELPHFGRTLREGWPYLLAFGLLIYFLMVARMEVAAPFYATALLIALAMLRPETRWNRARITDLIGSTGRLLAEIVAILAAVGFLIGSLSVTGLAGTLSSELVRAAGDNTLMLLVMGAIACFILGMGMTITAAYIFLAITMAPALIRQGLDPMAVHLFILYWASLSNVTPPVGLAVIAASGIANSRLMGAMMEAVRFATVKYVLPFYFVYAPVMVLQQFELGKFITVMTSALIGVAVLAYALQGYLPFAGTVRDNVLGLLVRVALVGGALLLMFPAGLMTVIGLVTVFVVYGLVLALGRHGSVAVTIPPAEPRSS
ncbi:MAG: TRAP transporter permease [Alphaproteobacteria bacterium]